jgi:putative membrane protein
MMRYGWYGPWGGFGFLTWVPEVLFWLLLIFLFVRLFRHPDHHHWMDSDRKSPLDYLKERYAKGEIDKKQFEEMKKDIGEGH